MKKFIFTLLCLSLAGSSYAATIIVDVNGDGHFETIQAAINDANEGDTIEIWPGTYTGPGNRDIDFLGKAITVRSTDPNDPNIVAVTIIDCNGSSTEHHRGFYFHSGEDANSILNGLTITNGSFVFGGGGIFCENDSSPLINNCIITRNQVGGICLSSASPTITNCFITHNTGIHAGPGINCSESNSIINNCIISENQGGISCFGSNLTITNCTISNNVGRIGGGICFRGSNLTITDCNINDNTAIGMSSSYCGGGIYCGYQSKLSISNCTISGNKATYRGGGIYCEASELFMTSCRLIENTSYGGGGVYIKLGVSIELIDCIINKNTASCGGGICARGDGRGRDLKIDGCVISGNSGGGIYGDDAYYPGLRPNHPFPPVQSKGLKITITNSLISGNTSPNKGGGMYLRGVEDFKSINCTISDNRAQHIGGGIYIHCKDMIVSNGILWGNTADYGEQIAIKLIEKDGGIYYEARRIGVTAVIYSDVQGGSEGVYVISQGPLFYPSKSLRWDMCNIDTDPLFVERGYWGDVNDANIIVEPNNPNALWVEGDYHLMSYSDCVDAGTDDPIGGLTANDLDGNSRIIDGDGDGYPAVDMGAYEQPVEQQEPVLEVNQRKFEFRAVVGCDVDGKTFEISNLGTGILNWHIIEDCNWLEVLPDEGSADDKVDEVLLSVDSNSLPVGDYNCIITVYGDGAIRSPIEIPVILHIGQLWWVPEDYNTIQEAIDGANDWDVVEVADGVYTGFGNVNLSFRGKSVKLCSVNGPNNCIIDCNCEPIYYWMENYGAYFTEGEDANSIFEGFTVLNSKSSGIGCYESSPTISNCVISGSRCGISSFSSNLRIIGCQIKASTEGGLSLNEGNPLIENCLITGNKNAQPCSFPSFHRYIYQGGGGICLKNCNAVILNCDIVENRSEKCPGVPFPPGWPVDMAENPVCGCGGGICCVNSNLKISNCRVSRNLAERRGGAIAFYIEDTKDLGKGNQLIISNSVISGNTILFRLLFGEVNYYLRENNVIALLGYDLADLRMRNCVITGNHAKDTFRSFNDDYAVFSFGAGNLVSLKNCIFWENYPSYFGFLRFIYLEFVRINYCDASFTEQGQGCGNINTDPCFVEDGWWVDVNDANIIVEPDDPNATWLDGDYHLLVSSPCTPVTRMFSRIRVRWTSTECRG